MEIFNTIIPIFTVILLGWLARHRGFISPEFSVPANRLVFYFAIPAMVFGAIARGSLKTDFNPLVLGCTLAAVVSAFGTAWITGRLIPMPVRRRGTFVQNGFHGNLGYVGLAVAYYYLGEEGFVSASLLIGFMMILQNLLSVFTLQFYSDTDPAHHDPGKIISKVMGNPVILSAIAGILFSLSGASLPVVVKRTLEVIGGMALPMALLLIGATLDFRAMRSQLSGVALTSFLKLVVTPGLGLMFYHLAGLSLELFLPGLILLSSPAATISYIMAMEMNGDVHFAGAAISASTLLSAITFFAWLHMAW